MKKDNTNCSLTLDLRILATPARGEPFCHNFGHHRALNRLRSCPTLNIFFETNDFVPSLCFELQLMTGQDAPLLESST